MKAASPVKPPPPQGLNGRKRRSNSLKNDFGQRSHSSPVGQDFAEYLDKSRGDSHVGGMHDGYASDSFDGERGKAERIASQAVANPDVVKRGRKGDAEGSFTQALAIVSGKDTAVSVQATPDSVARGAEAEEAGTPTPTAAATAAAAGLTALTTPPCSLSLPGHNRRDSQQEQGGGGFRVEGVEVGAEEVGEVVGSLSPSEGGNSPNTSVIVGLTPDAWGSVTGKAVSGAEAAAVAEVSRGLRTLILIARAVRCWGNGVPLRCGIFLHSMPVVWVTTVV